MTPAEIKQLRTRLGWSQTQCAAHFHVTTASVSQWETGLTRPDPYRIAAMKQLRDRLDAVSEAQRQEFLRGLAAAALGLGVGGLLAYLFGKNTD